MFDLKGIGCLAVIGVIAIICAIPAVAWGAWLVFTHLTIGWRP